jgi:hypothetical protein
MTRRLIYSDAPGSTIELTAYSRLYQWSATTHAKEGSVSHSTLVIDDPDAIFDFIGHRRVYAYEDTAASSNQVMHNGFIQNAKVSRGLYRNGTQRIWTLDLADQNVLLHRRLMNGEDANRPAETDVARMSALVGLDDGIPMTELNTIDDTLYFHTNDPVEMDAVDYRTQPVGTGYIDDCAQHSGKNYHAWYRENTGEFSLWYGSAASSNWVSTKRLSNILSDVDSTTTFAVGFENEAILDRDNSRVASGVMLPFDGVASGSNTISGTVYVQNQETTDIYAAIDWLAPSLNVKSKDTALARANRYLADAATPDDLIHCFVEVPAVNVNDILAGQLIDARFEHFPLYNVFSTFRILARTVTEISEDPTNAYRLDLELSPVTIPAGADQYFTSTQIGGCESGPWPEGSPGADRLLVGFLAQRDTSTSDATIVPIGTTDSTGCDNAQQIAGTGWTHIIDGYGGGASGVSVTLAYRDSVAGEPAAIVWGGPSGGGLSGTARPRSHQIAISGLSGAPTVTVSSAGATAMGAVMTSSPIVVTGPGYIFAGFGYRCTGPADGSSPDITLTARAPAEDLTQGWAYGGFGPYSWFGMIHVTPAMFAVTDTYDITVDRSATPRAQYGRWWLMGFWPE